MNRVQARDAQSQLLHCCFYLLITALSREVTSVCLSPVYGSLNTRHPVNWHLDIVSITLLNLFWPTYRSHWSNVRTDVWWKRLPFIIALLGSSQAVFLSYTTRFSSRLGPDLGSLISQVISRSVLTITVVPYAVSSFQLWAWHTQMRDACLKSLLLVSFGAFGIILTLGQLTHLILQQYYGSLFSLGSHSLQIIIAGLFAFSQRKLPLLTVSIFVLTLSSILPNNLATLNASLGPEGYTLLDRQQSTTGYISVLDNLKAGFRVLRCDHSLLGGEWIRYREGLTPRLREPIYAIFVTLEAVLLAQTEKTSLSQSKSPADQRALMIGLGVGTSATAFIEHGIPTTIVEIDPVVHRFATQYFGLPSNHTAVIEDANHFLDINSDQRAEYYDYIIHDVFTGGAEPLELFTLQFIEGLERLLNDEGTIAINYAGDLLQPSAASVVKTALAVFPSCRLFRETAAPTGAFTQDMTNMVIFCRKQKGSFTFREPIEADFLGSQARQEFLLPRFEITAREFAARGAQIITKESIVHLKRSQKSNARTHWYFMRDVIPARVWETF